MQTGWQVYMQVGIQTGRQAGSNLEPAPNLSLLQFGPWSFDGSDRLVEILRWSFRSYCILDIFEIDL